MGKIGRGLASLAFFAMAGMAAAAEAPAPQTVGSVFSEETRVSLGKCFFDDQIDAQTKLRKPKGTTTAGADKSISTKGLIPGAIASAAAGAVLDLTVGALKAAGEDKSTSPVVAFAANGWMYRLDASGAVVLNTDYECIQVTSGSFWNGLRLTEKERAAAAKKPEDLYVVPVNDTDSVVGLDQRVLAIDSEAGAEVNLAKWTSVTKGTVALDWKTALLERQRQLRHVRFFFEARIAPREGANDKFAIAPNALFFEQPLKKGFFELGAEARNIHVSLTLLAAGDAEKPLASIALPFYDVPPNTFMSPLYFAERETGLFVVPAISGEEATFVTQKKALLTKASDDMKLAYKPLADPPKTTEATAVEKSDLKVARTAYCKLINTRAEEAAAKAKTKTALPLECDFELQAVKDPLDLATVKLENAKQKDAALNNVRDDWESFSHPSGVACKWPTDKPLVCVLSKDGGKPLRAITVTSTIVEVKEGSKFAAFLGKVLGAAQPTIQQAIDAKTPAGKASAAADLETKQGIYLLALKDVELMEAKLAEAKADSASKESDIKTAEKNLLTAQIAAKKAREDAGG